MSIKFAIDLVDKVHTALRWTCETTQTNSNERKKIRVI